MKILLIPVTLVSCFGGEFPQSKLWFQRKKEEYELKEIEEWKDFMEETRKLLEE